jgi:uncharacterized linocin/CFP29 family protein
MNTLRYVGHDEPLTTEQGQYIMDRVVYAARREMTGRKLMPIRKIDSGAQTFGYDTLTESANAALDLGWPGRETLDIVNLTRSTVAIPTVHKEFQINKLDIAASRMSGTPLNTTTAESAAYKVALEEDTLLLLGYAGDTGNYDINGLYNAAGNSRSAAGDWGTSANIVTDINAMIALLLADNITPPYNLVLHPDQYVETLANIANTAVQYKTWVKENIGGDIYVSATQTASTGIMTKANPVGMFEFVVAEDLTVETETLSKKEGESLFGRVYVRGLPVVYDSNAICKISGH